jgi:serine phosphatase RsbU (regulator of sigma subunit)
MATGLCASKTAGLLNQQQLERKVYGLQELLTLGGEFNARELRDLIMAAVGEFSEGPVQDDATLMVLKVD